MFPILRVNPEALIGDEQLGSKSKFWFARENDELWLFKLARDNTGEDWAEKVAAEIARHVQVDAATVELADYFGRRGSASLSFVGPTESLVHGNEILASHIFGYDRQKKLKQSDHTFDNIVAAIRKLVADTDWYHEVLKDLAPFLVLDALVCNTDRHHENWGFLMNSEDSLGGVKKKTIRIAPSFDHASSLGRELLDDLANNHLAANGVAAYARRGHGGIYWNPTDHRGANPLHLVELASSKFPDYFRDALGNVAGIPVKQLIELVDMVPNLVISEPSRRFAKALITYTHGVISGLST